MCIGYIPAHLSTFRARRQVQLCGSRWSDKKINTAWKVKTLTLTQIPVSAGHTVLVVGGAVRDLLLGLTPKDYDLLTSGHLTEVSLPA
jgi:hypothetical protein